MKPSSVAALLASATCLVVAAAGPPAMAQPAADAGASSAGATQAPVAQQARLAEGTEIDLRLDEKLSSKTNTAGDRFQVSLASDLKLADGTVIPAGCKGVGEVTEANKSGMLGKAGSLNIKFDYLKVGDTRVPLRGAKGNTGKGSVGSVIALTALFGIAGFLVHGHNIEVQPGQALTAFVDQDTVIHLPVAAPTAT
jgi:hypothetical protein